MDISGVDVDFLSDEEILELCSNIVDRNSNDIFVLKSIDIENLSYDKVNEIYDDVLYKSHTQIQLTDRQILDNNYNIVDMNENEIVVFNGRNIDIDNLSDNEILKLYDDTIDQKFDSLLATTSSKQGAAYCFIEYRYVAPKQYDEYTSDGYTASGIKCEDATYYIYIDLAYSSATYYIYLNSSDTTPGKYGTPAYCTYFLFYDHTNDDGQTCTVWCYTDGYVSGKVSSGYCSGGVK